ncbi:MAG: hypothetical protein JRM79_04740 [Nitrososphaerota archaeon]|nr:hypothetical protein [Nitrososphaerota archaeon]MDG6938682.1 hypothetical protein [Nitrososphaerota archaeon]MDG6952936.1 hypothetical protein [Nitrososphaerota archaeon]MDG6956793.1 hypothetical protein [Nitrososphaerota archaeon]MDG6958934.1 hypothetical protein [Nitrososphaerota archaeon]
MPKIQVAMYGLTSEAYRLAADIGDKAQVTIVDETLQMAMELEPGFMKKNPVLQEVMAEEPLLSFKPLEQVLGEAQVVFFTPRLRRPSEETLIEAGSKLRDLAKYLSKGVSLVNALPSGPGGNSENIMLVEKQTGLQVGSTLTYAYMPLRPRENKPAVVAFAGAQENGPLQGLGYSQSSQNVFSAELEYAATVMETAVASVTEIEVARKAREAKVSLQRTSGVYLDEFSRYLYELKAIQASEETGESISYLAGATLKSFDNYIRYVVDETREALKEKQLKASRTKISLLWALDRYEMRGERLQVADSIQQRLRDYVTDVELVAGRAKGGPGLFDPLKHNVVIVCSKDDLDALKSSGKSMRGGETTIISATPGLKRE